MQTVNSVHALKVELQAGRHRQSIRRQLWTQKEMREKNEEKKGCSEMQLRLWPAGGRGRRLH